ncbi:lebercilin [Diorhabda carinulata]|uniref:lebercilin n=1 Tax=Diorhabda carinulata TaxID=1163345 RepID=UPI0025A20E09|nr:lebercilin [Diorhabda carinulata]
MTSCSSSVSVDVNNTPNSDASRSKSCQSVCTTNSSCYLQKRKAKNPLMYPLRPSYSKPSNSVTNSVRQRVLSAKLLKLRSIQSQLNDANFHLSELARENQFLKNLQKRQDKALSKYENTSADLPRLIRSHEEQLRAVTEKNKSQRLKIKELNDLLKIRDEELSKTQEKLIHFEKLNKDKRLLDREKMLEQIEDLKMKLKNADEINSVLNRKLALEQKTAKQRLNNESMKYRQSQKEMAQALTEIDRLTSLLEAKENVVHPRKNRFNRVPGQSVSTVTLGALHQSSKIKNTDTKEKLTTIVDDLEETKTYTNIKLEPIKCPKNEETSKKNNGILTLPSESIKNRLSSGSKSRESVESDNGSELSLSNFDSSGEEKSRCNDTNESSCRSTSGNANRSMNRTSLYGSNDEIRYSSDEKLENVQSHIDSAIEKAVNNVDTEFEKIGNYCSGVVSNVRMCSERLEAQRESLRSYKKDTNTILETFEKTEKFENKLKESFMNFDPLNDDFLKDILSDDYKIKSKKDRNENVKKETKFGVIDRKKLLNTLKAIDAGDSVDSLDDLHTKNIHKFREVDQLIG